MTGLADGAALLASAETLLGRRELAAALEALDEAERCGEEPDRCCGGRWLAHMLRGEFERAWRESDAIRARVGIDANRLWNGEDWRGKRVMVRCLHGSGDAVQMLRFAPRLRELCAGLTVEVAPRLVELARCIDGVDEVITWGEDAPERKPEWEVQVEVTELPYVLRLEADELPVAARYVRVPDGVRREVKKMMGRKLRPRVGVVWAAGEWNRARGLPLACVERLVKEEGVEFWSLQGGAEASAWSELGAGLRDGAECGDGILRLAAAIEAMDLVVTVDTLAAHLAGALGRPAWVLLQAAADWRWMVGREDSPWYPSLRLYRQSEEGSWSELMERVTGDLRRWRGERL